MNDKPSPSTESDQVAEAAAQIDQLIADVGPDRAREMLELMLTEMVVKADPESENP